MNISFSTICPVNAKRYLESDKFYYLSETQKIVALKHLGEGKLRVQDPEMYASPKLEIQTREIYEAVLDADTRAEGKAP